jgi:hypothetical protein
MCNHHSECAPETRVEWAARNVQYVSHPEADLDPATKRTVNQFLFGGTDHTTGRWGRSTCSSQCEKVPNQTCIDLVDSTFMSHCDILNAVDELATGGGRRSC